MPIRQTLTPRRHRFDWGLFFNESIKSFATTASVVPSSPYLARAMLRSIDFARATAIVEVGVGTGAMTHELLQRMRPDARLYALDINPRFIAFLRKAITDRRPERIMAEIKPENAVSRHLFEAHGFCRVAHGEEMDTFELAMARGT